MPQMAPLNWVLLMIMFIIMFLTFNILVYYSFLYKPKLWALKTSTNQVNWKW